MQYIWVQPTTETLLLRSIGRSQSNTRLQKGKKEQMTNKLTALLLELW